MPSDDVGDVGALLGEVFRRAHLRRIFSLGMGLQLIQQLSVSLVWFGSFCFFMLPSLERAEVHGPLSHASLPFMNHCHLPTIDQ